MEFLQYTQYAMVSKLLFKKTFKRRKRFNFSAMRSIKDMEGDSQKLAKVYKDELAVVEDFTHTRLSRDDNMVKVMAAKVEIGVQ